MEERIPPFFVLAFFWSTLTQEVTGVWSGLVLSQNWQLIEGRHGVVGGSIDIVVSGPMCAR